MSDVVKNDVVKKTEYGKLVAKVNNIDTSESVLKTQYQTDKTELGKKIPNVADFIKEAKLTELENKTLDISNLATKTAWTSVEKKKPSVSSLLKKKQTITLKLQILKTNLIIIIMINMLILQSLTKTDFDATLSSLNRIIMENKTKHFLVENELNKLKTFDSSHLKKMVHKII